MYRPPISEALATRPNIDISAVRQQQLDHILVARSQRFEQRRSTVDLPMVDVGAVLEQLTRRSLVTHAHCCEQRRLTVVIHRLVQVGAVLDQHLDDIMIVELNSASQ